MAESENMVLGTIREPQLLAVDDSVHDPDVSFQANGAPIKGGTWFETGAEMLNGGTLNYFAVPWGIVNNPLPLIVVTAVEVVLMGAVEKFRKEGEGPPGYSPGFGKFESDVFSGLDNLYPGAVLPSSYAHPSENDNDNECLGCPLDS